MYGVLYSRIVFWLIARNTNPDYLGFNPILSTCKLCDVSQATCLRFLINKLDIKVLPTS